MQSKTRMLTALDMGTPDHLPCTTHELIPLFLETYVGGVSEDEFFDRFELDKTIWLNPLSAAVERGELVSPVKNLYQPFIETADWRLRTETLFQSGHAGVKYILCTPKKELTMTLESNDYTSWISEPLIKEPGDIDIIARFAPPITCDADKVHSTAVGAGDSAIIRGMIPGFEIYGQPGCWQDAACLFGIEKLIYKTFDDPEWVKTLLSIMQKRKLAYVDTLSSSVGDSACSYDLIEMGGGDASTTVISPKMFREFVAPYDVPIIKKVREKGVRVTYHTCGGMMPILEDIADMGVSAMETFTPPGMGGDVDLAEAKRRIGDKACLIGGFDQGHFFTNATEAEVESEVRRCFAAAGGNGGFILTPSDHFFSADPKLLMAFSRAAQSCIY
jgi:uroporphyrinogen decarboxylase